jgi:histidyl-tRNA synthetase
MSDIFSPEVEIWQELESRARDVMTRFDFREVRTPIVEPASVYLHSLGDTSDIVQKQMYAFETRGGKQVCLRPEGTAGVMRFVSGHLQDMQDARLFYAGPMFRAERPQAGRKRQFHQFGVECIGSAAPVQDAEVIALQSALFAAWGIEDVTFQINTRGSMEDFPKILDGLRGELESRKSELCDECQRRMESNVLRVLDCKNPACKAIAEALPPITSWMEEESVSYFDQVCKALDDFGVTYTVNPLLVRGLDYYQHSIWEVTSTALGAQDALSGGGRYVMSMGSKAIEGVGFGIGMERVLMALPEAVKAEMAADRLPLIYLVSLDDEARKENLIRMKQLRDKGFRVRMDVTGRSLKAQMKASSRHGASVTLVLGDSEIKAGTVQLKEMKTGEQRQVPVDDLEHQLQKFM